MTINRNKEPALIYFSVPLEPVPFKRPRFGKKKKVFDEQRYFEFKEAFGIFALKAMRGRDPFTGAIKITADFYKPRPKKSRYKHFGRAVVPSFGDVDNHLKAVLDALNGICYEDDRQVIDAHARKFFGNPHIEITLVELD